MRAPVRAPHAPDVAADADLAAIVGAWPRLSASRRRTLADLVKEMVE